MSELAQDPAILKLIDYAKVKRSISYDEVNDMLPDSLVDSDRIEEVMGILEKNGIALEAENADVAVEGADEDSVEATEEESVEKAGGIPGSDGSKKKEAPGRSRQRKPLPKK